MQFWVSNPTWLPGCPKVQKLSINLDFPAPPSHYEMSRARKNWLVHTYFPPNRPPNGFYLSNLAMPTHPLLSKSLRCKFGHHFANMQTCSSWLNKRLCPIFFFNCHLLYWGEMILGPCMVIHIWYIYDVLMHVSMNTFYFYTHLFLFHLHRPALMTM